MSINYSDYNPNDCALCLALYNSDLIPVFYNKVLFKYKGYVVLPSIGPLALGHILIVSSKHYSNMASMGNDAIKEYSELISYVKNIPFYKDQGFLEVEHGSTEDYCAGACVVHTHIHIIPGFAAYDGLFEGILPPIIVGDILANLININKPYIFLRGNSGPVRLYEAFDVPCQAIRKAICNVIGREDWDWRKFPKHELIKKTIKIWEKISNDE